MAQRAMKRSRATNEPEEESLHFQAGSHDGRAYAEEHAGAVLSITGMLQQAGAAMNAYRDAYTARGVLFCSECIIPYQSGWLHGYVEYHRARRSGDGAAQ